MTPQQKRELATELRQAGCTYKEIAQQTGYSVDWCKQNLKTVQKNSTEKELIKEAIRLAKSNEGITNGQIRILAQQTMTYADTTEYKNQLDKVVRRFKTAINKEPNTVIRPYWMQPMAPQQSFNLIMSSVDSVQQSMDDAVLYVRQQLDLDQSYDKSIRYSIIQLLYCGGLSLDAVMAQCDRLSSLVQELKNKNDPTTPANTYNNIVTEKCTLFIPSSKKCISADLHFPDEGDLVDLDDLFEGEE